MAIRIALRGLILLFPLFLSAVAQSVDDPAYRIHVKDGSLYRGASRYRFRAIEVPYLTRSDATSSDIAVAYNRVSDVGANSLCFYLYGLSEDGSSLSEKGEQAVRVMAQQARARYMSAICRIFPPDSPADPGYRRAAVRSVAQALADEYRLLYWIDGPGSADLVAEFRRLAPDLTVAAPEGSDVIVMTPPLPAKTPFPAFLVGEVAPTGTPGASFVLLDAQDPYDAFETMSIHPIETQPWEPDDSVLAEQERNEGWTSLFDGKSLSGWAITGGNQEGFVCREGSIEWNGKGGGMLRSRDRYENFILRLDWKIEEGGNSGIFLRAPRANRASKIGMEFQLRGDYGEPPSSGSTGAIYDVLSPAVNAGKPVGEWNSVEIQLDGTYLKATLNGQTVLDIEFSQHSELKNRLRRGFIGLQDHGDYVAFRNIRIKELPVSRWRRSLDAARR
jgi:hypothetical protein